MGARGKYQRSGRLTRRVDMRVGGIRLSCETIEPVRCQSKDRDLDSINWISVQIIIQLESCTWSATLQLTSHLLKFRLVYAHVPITKDCKHISISSLCFKLYAPVSRYFIHSRARQTMESILHLPIPLNPLNILKCLAFRARRKFGSNAAGEPLRASASGSFETLKRPRAKWVLFRRSLGSSQLNAGMH
jgi:hypothetical protein